MDINKLNEEEESKWLTSIDQEKNKQCFLALEIPFENLECPKNLINTLKSNGLFNLSDLLNLQKKDYLLLKNFGEDSFRQLYLFFQSNKLTIPLTLDQAKNFLVLDNSFLKNDDTTKEDKNSTVFNPKAKVLSWKELEEIVNGKSLTIENFETEFNEIKSLKNIETIFNFLLNIFFKIDNLEPNEGFCEVERFEIEKKIFQIFLIKKFISLNSYESNSNWVTNFFTQIDEYSSSSNKLFLLIGRLSGLTLQELGDIYGITREAIRLNLKRFMNAIFIDIKDLISFSDQIKKETEYNYKKNFIDKLFEKLNRLPTRKDNMVDEYKKDEFYKEIISLNPMERLDLLKEFNIVATEEEFNYHYEYLKNNDSAGVGYWQNLDHLKEYIFRHANFLGEPELMPKQTSFYRRSVSAEIQRLGGQSKVAEILGLKYQGQLVNDEKGRAFWTEKKLLVLIKEVNVFYNQDQNKLPQQVQIKNFLKQSKKDIYLNKKPESIIAAFCKSGNLDWSQVAERFNKEYQKPDKGVTKTFIKSFVRDLGEHLAALTPSELYVLFQAQGIKRNHSQFSRTFDVLIDAVQSGAVNKNDLIDWSNNVDVPSIKELLDIGSDVKSLSKEEKELLLLRKRSLRIKEYSAGTKEININDIKKEDLPSLDAGKTLRALDKAANIIESQGSDLKLINFLKAKATAKLWDSCFIDEGQLIKQINSNYFDKDAYSSQVKKAFLDEYNGAKNLELPSSYKFRDLKGVFREPKLMQKLVAFRLKRDRRLLNLSGTGTGKTLSAILSAQVCKANRIFITCPNGVVESWKTALNSAFPDAVLHLKPNNWEIKLVEEKTNVVIVNHERFQDRFSEELLKFCLDFRSDMFVIDEIHQSKSRKENISSQRRGLIKEFIRISANLNHEIKVLGLSATPVINNLYEGRSLIELVTQKILGDVNDEDINSCMNLYQHFVINSIRMNPGNLSRTKIITKKINASNLVKEVVEINNSQKLVKYHDLERLFVKPKLEILSEIIKRNNKTIIFITLIEGTLIPITNWLTKERFKYCVYTGGEKEASEIGFSDSLEEFIKGDAEVLVATIQCAGTGIDGLQSVCNKAIFFQLPWTSTEFEQSVGRLDRDGTEFESIEVFLPTTYIELPNGDNWSWCESKLERIRSKKDFAKAAVDGDLPDSGSIISPQEATKYWLKWLKRLEGD